MIVYDFFSPFYVEIAAAVFRTESNWRSRSTIFSWRIKS